jgi:hypothetical protein
VPILAKVRKRKEKYRKCDVTKRFLPPDAISHKDVGDLDKLYAFIIYFISFIFYYLYNNIN